MKGTVRVTFICLLLLALPSLSSCKFTPEQTLQKGLIPRIETFEAVPSVIDEGAVTYLRWQVADANSVSINNGIGNVAIKGTVPVSPNSTTSYTLTASNFAGEATANTQIIVNSIQGNQPRLPVIELFYADHTSILSGESVRLSWNVIGATNVIITPIGQFDSQGTVDVNPTETTVYTLIASNAAGQSTAGLILDVKQRLSNDATTTKTIVLYPLEEGSGSLVKGSGYLSYTRYDDICTGDTSLNMASRAFLAFDISSIPSNTIIEQATLELSDYTQKGTPSYSRSMWGNMGALEIYYIEYEDLGDAGHNAYNKSGKLVAGGKFKDYPFTPWTLDVINSEDGEPILQNLVYEGKTRCQFRIQFFSSTNWDSTSDMLCFDEASLTIKYKVTE